MARRTRYVRSLSARLARRRGYTLVFFAMLFFSLLALAALVIDLGFARVTQRQLQNAAENGALEGLRGQGTYAYAQRREAARELVEWHFDEELSPAGAPSESGRFGAGPAVEFSGGAGDADLAASQLLTVDPDHPLYRPTVVDGAESNNEFRVSLERGSETEPTADLYAQGPAVPYLFARGSLMNRSLLQRGITVRGEAVARPSPALSIGLANQVITPPLPGLLPLALELSYWNGLAVSTPTAATVAAGEIGTSGRFFTLASSDSMPLTIGRTLPAAAAALDGNYSGYIPVYAQLSTSATPRVIGFGSAQVVVSNGGTAASITRLPAVVGAENVSAVRCFSVNLTPAEATEVFSLVSHVEEPLLAPSPRSDIP